MKLNEFNYDLPKELIAQEPLADRDASRLLVVGRDRGTIEEKTFKDITDYIKEGDCLVLNNTRVIPVRIYGKRKTGGKVEIFLLDTSGEELRALVRPGKKLKNGEVVELESGDMATILEEKSPGRLVKFDAPIEKILKGGHMPLPPYIAREDTGLDKEKYQTVYAEKDGASAAPTAGLHFTTDLLSELESRGVQIAYVTLHTSYGTFSPVKARTIEEHKMHSEYFEIDESTCNIINRTKKSGGKVIAVGTTSTRVLETVADDNGILSPSSGETDIFIYPGCRFKLIDGLVTNFHLPESTLIMLVSAFAGKELIFKAYERAIESKFRFFSYGDAMLIL